jgi:serine protease DegQ
VLLEPFSRAFGFLALTRRKPGTMPTGGAVNKGSLLNTLSNELADAVETAGASVVTVHDGRHRPASGTVCAIDLVLMADHSLGQEEELTVRTGDGRTLRAAFAGRDPSTDLALLKVDGLSIGAPAISTEPVRVGSLVIALGRSWGGGLTASAGVVGAIGGPFRRGRGPEVERVIRADVSLRPGFSGGALIDTAGSVVGIATAGLMRGVPLAVPVDLAWRVAEQLGTHGHIRRGYLGIGTQPVRIPASQRAGRAQDQGLIALAVSDDSPAARGGLLVGDIVVGFDGQPVGDPDELLGLLDGARIEKKVIVEVLRGGVLRSLDVKVGERGTGEGR